MEVSFDLTAAALAGLVAGLFMEVPVLLQRALGRPVKQDIFRTWGQNLLRIPGAAGYVAGFLFHEALSVAVALLYAAFIDIVGATGALLLWGLLGAVVHYAVAAFVIAALPSTNPATGALGGHGIGYRAYGRRDVVTSVVAHLLFGAVVGTAYALLHPHAGAGSIL